MADTNILIVKDSTANPAPLGLLAFGVTTVLLNFHNAGFYPMSSMILGMGLCYGGAAQVVAGLMEWKKNNSFGTTAFISYGFFWISLVCIFLIPNIDSKLAPTAPSLAAYMALWGLFTLGLFIGTLRLSAALMVVFATLTVLFAMLAINFAAAPGVTFLHLTGYEGILCGASAIYTGLAVLLNEMYGRTVLPTGPVAR